MTYKEKLEEIAPGAKIYTDMLCPFTFFYCELFCTIDHTLTCDKCWNSEYKNEPILP